MALTLTIISGPTLDPGAPRSHTWNQRGGTLGRAGNNDWILPDPEQSISRCHARVRYLQGRYFLEDTSTNGILLSDGVTPMESHEPHPLRDGEEFGIGCYRIRVRIDADPFTSMAPIGQSALGDMNEQTPLDPLALLGGRVAAPNDPLPRPETYQSYLNEHFDPPPIEAPLPASSGTPPLGTPAFGGPDAAGSALLPDDWWTEDAAASPPAPLIPAPLTDPEAPAAPARTAPVQKSATADPAVPSGARLPGTALRELLHGAGLDPEHLPPELAENLGGILRVAVQGIMDLMRARAEIKNEFRMSVTMIQASDNNPLKFSTSVEDALNNLLVKRNPSYLSAIEAFESGFQDLRFHQVALLYGMREAFFEMLRQLDPETLERRFDERTSQGSVLGRIAGPKPWDQYKHLFADIQRDTEGYFNRLFGETFVAAYERRMQELQEHVRRRN